MSHRCNAEENHLLSGDLGIGARCGWHVSQSFASGVNTPIANTLAQRRTETILSNASSHRVRRVPCFRRETASKAGSHVSVCD
ncbi:hypothetical protein E2C01_099047 [Portunus trituberculatus]|uniref:Uncharacterized protein n=1 Tax=Portunus trituberculatus TaxID=210409 RepID=A0A5B7KEE3_PORTR|nr:hypothetical protein [Portunus trituberculatus]